MPRRATAAKVPTTRSLCVNLFASMVIVLDGSVKAVAELADTSSSILATLGEGSRRPGR